MHLSLFTYINVRLFVYQHYQLMRAAVVIYAIIVQPLNALLYRSVIEFSCKNEAYHNITDIASETEMLLISDCPHEFVADIRNQLPLSTYIITREEHSNDGRLMSMEKYQSGDRHDVGRNFVEIETKEQGMELLQDGGSDLIIIFRNVQFIQDEGFMLSLVSAYYLKGIQWMLLLDESSSSQVKYETMKKWLLGGGWASRFLLDRKQSTLFDNSILEVTTDLFSQDVQLPVEKYDEYPFRYRSGRGDWETIPGRLDESTGPAYLVRVAQPPDWPYRIAYHGAGSMEALRAIQADGWRLKGCFKRCFHGKGIYLSPSFIVAMRHYGVSWETADGRLFSLCFQVAIRNEEIKAPTYGFTRYDPQWHDIGGQSPLNFKFHNAAPEFVVPEGPESSQILGIVLMERLERPKVRRT